MRKVFTALPRLPGPAAAAVLVACGLLLAPVPALAGMGGNLAATGIEVHANGDGTWAVTVRDTVAWFGGTKPFTFTRTLLVRRDGEVVAQPLDEVVTVQPRDACGLPDGTCPDRTCHYRVKGKPASFGGRCGAIPRDPRGRCACRTGTNDRTLFLDLRRGDELVYVLTASPGFRDLDPGDDALAVIVH